jgi:hypothetical protein
MRVLVVGSKDWSNYSEIMRQFTLLLEDLKYNEEKSITFVHGGNQGAENMVSEYVGKIEKFMRQKGYSIKEELFKNFQQKNKSINDYNMMQSDVDFALVFDTKNCKRAHYCIKILQELEIPTTVINS